ncbi:NYN domain-containing protein [Reinekea forsetii]|nr:NYN domain-containing protein [Reinekea forsetii]
MKTTTIIVDVQNVYYTTRQAFQKNFNYNAFWAEALENRTLVSASAFAIDRGDEKQKQFQNILRAIGFDVRLKPYIQRADGSSKGDWDVGIAVEALEQAPHSDEIILVSGDGDFDILAKTIREKHGCEVVVYGVKALTANALIKEASRYREIDTNLLM